MAFNNNMSNINSMNAYNPMWMPNSSTPYNYYNYPRQTPNPIPSQSLGQQQESRQNNIIWVKGKENARSMQLPPNSTVILLDSEVGKFYIKTTDDIGLGKLRVFVYSEEPDEKEKEKEQNISELDLSNYVTRD